MPRLRIAILCESFPPDPCGGIGTSCFNLFSGLKSKGYAVKVFTIANGSSTTDTADIYRTGFPHIIKVLLPLVVAGWIKLQERGGLKYQFADTLLGVLYGLKLNHAIKKYSPDIIVVPDKGMSNLFIKPPKHCKVVFVSHHNPMRFVDNPLIGKHSLIDAKLAVMVQQKALRKVDAVICPSIYMKQMFNDTYLFNSPVAVISNIVDAISIGEISPLNLHKNYDLPTNSPIVYIPSAGSLIKGSIFVFEIIRRLSSDVLRPIGFYLSGNIGLELTELLKFVPKNAHLIIPGKTTYQENIAYIKGCNVCVSPTLLESFGMALLEAQICGLPCVSFDVGGNCEVLNNSSSGYLAPFLDLEGLILNAVKICSIKFMEIKTEKITKYTYNTDAILNQYVDFFTKLSTRSD